MTIQNIYCNSNSTHIDHLPDDILGGAIFPWLLDPEDTRSMAAIHGVCKRWHQLMESNPPYKVAMREKDFFVRYPRMAISRSIYYPAPLSSHLMKRLIHGEKRLENPERLAALITALMKRNPAALNSARQVYLQPLPRNVQERILYAFSKADMNISDWEAKTISTLIFTNPSVYFLLWSFVFSMPEDFSLNPLRCTNLSTLLTWVGRLGLLRLTQLVSRPIQSPEIHVNHRMRNSFYNLVLLLSEIATLSWAERLLNDSRSDLINYLEQYLADFLPWVVPPRGFPKMKLLYVVDKQIRQMGDLFAYPIFWACSFAGHSRISFEGDSYLSRGYRIARRSLAASPPLIKAALRVPSKLFSRAYSKAQAAYSWLFPPKHPHIPAFKLSGPLITEVDEREEAAIAQPISSIETPASSTR